MKRRIDRFAEESNETTKEKEMNEMQRKELAAKINAETVIKNAHSKGLDSDREALAKIVSKMNK